MMKEKQPDFLFLMETKISLIRMQSACIQLGFEGMLTIDPIDLSGGFALLWKKASEVEI